MKKTLSIALTACLLLSITACFSGCGSITNLFKTQIDSGTEAAKLLLANERLDENLIGQKIDIGLNANSANTLSASTTVVRNGTTLATAPSNGITFLSASASASSSAQTHTWSEFPNCSPSMVEFTQFMSGVEHQAERVAANIANMKANVGVVDKWVKVGRDLQMLRVFESADVLFVKDMYDDIHVYYRYTDENAKNVYDMYSFMSYNDGTTGEIRTMLIPGERCEYMYENSNGFIDYFIAENSRGYWMATRFGFLEEPDSDYKSASFSPLIIKDGLGYGAWLSVDSHAPSELESAWYTIFDPTQNRELFRISEAFGRYDFELYYSAIRDGLVSVSATDVSVDTEDNVYMTSAVSSMVTASGSHQVAPLVDGVFTFAGGYVQYDYGNRHYLGNLNFGMSNPQMPLEQACTEFGSYVKGIGLDLHCDMDRVAQSLEHTTLLVETFADTFEWNGYKMSNLDNVILARQTLHEQYDAARREYEAIKDYEVVSSRQMLSSDAHFAALTVNSMGNNTFDGNEIVISNLSASTTDTALFEDGLEYVLKVGLALLDENGLPISVNTVPLFSEAEVALPFGGDSIELSASGTYTVPKNLHSGRYAVVTYMATADEGIRVSDMTKIAFVEIVEGEIESAAMHMEATCEADHLIFTYAIKNIHRITLTATKEAYSYDEIRHIMMIDVLSYGAPYHGAVLEFESGETVPQDGTLTVGNTYRMMCYLQTDDGLAQSYVYLTIE